MGAAVANAGKDAGADGASCDEEDSGSEPEGTPVVDEVAGLLRRAKAAAASLPFNKANALQLVEAISTTFSHIRDLYSDVVVYREHLPGLVQVQAVVEELVSVIRRSRDRWLHQFVEMDDTNIDALRMLDRRWQRINTTVLFTGGCVSPEFHMPRLYTHEGSRDPLSLAYCKAALMQAAASGSAHLIPASVLNKVAKLCWCLCGGVCPTSDGGDW